MVIFFLLASKQSENFYHLSKLTTKVWERYLRGIRVTSFRFGICPIFVELYSFCDFGYVDFRVQNLTYVCKDNKTSMYVCIFQRFSSTNEFSLLRYTTEHVHHENLEENTTVLRIVYRKCWWRFIIITIQVSNIRKSHLSSCNHYSS